MQSEELASLPVGTEVSAKYKGAFCEAKVKKVNKNVLCKVTFKQGLGSYDLYDSQLTYTSSLTTNSTVEAKHPEKGSLHEATITKIIDKSQYTVVFDDGDIATLRRNALRMKSGKHFNASESLDNLPLTHPEHFGTPVGSRRRGKFEEEEEEGEEEDTTDDEADLVPYNQKIGSVVCVEVPDKKSSKSKENWFPGLVVSPYAVSQEQGKIKTKEDFLVRSFKDNKFHTVPRTECKKFHKDMGRGVSDSAMLKALEHAQAYISNNENLPVHWDKEILLEMRDESTTEGESDDDELILSDSDELQSPEEKDHLVAELYKHMDERGTPINKNPCIGDQDVDLFKLFRFVQKLGGQQRVTNNNQWRVVAKKLGFETNWCVNQVRVCYKRYLQSFEELNRTLGCTLINHPRNTSLRVRHGSGRPLVRGVRTGSKVKDEDDKSSVSSQEGGDMQSPGGKKEEICDEIDLDGVKQKPEVEEKKMKKTVSAVVDKIVKDEPLEEEVEIFDNSKRVKEVKGKKGKEERMLTRPRRDSSSSLAAATELKAKKDEMGDSLKPRKEAKKEIKKAKEEDDKSDSGGSGPLRGNKTKKLIKKKEEEAFDVGDDECNSDLDNVSKKKKVQKKKGNKAAELAPVEPMGGDDGEEPQHLKLSVECRPGDKIKVFWLHGQIYEAKIIKTDKTRTDKWPKYYVHYQGWNQRYDEWITRGRIAENLTWNANPQKHSKSSKSGTPPPERTRQRGGEKQEKRSSDEEEKRDSDERGGSEEEKEDGGSRRKLKSARSSTPSSTPSSSRTSSPAHNKRTKSPAPRRPNSPKDSKEKTPGRDKKGMLVRTSSPAQRKSPLLKRQSSRNSLNKVSDDDFEISEPEEEEEKHHKKPVKPPVKEASEVKPETPKRTKSEGKSKKPSAEPEKEEEKKSEHCKTIMRSRRSNTPTKKLHDDPYVFQEPEPIEPMGPFVKIENISAAEIAKQTKSDAFQGDIAASKCKNDESDSKKEDSKDETEAKPSEPIKTEDIKEETKTEDDVPARAEAEKSTEEEKTVSAEEVKEEEADESQAGDKSDMRSSLFPHLSSLRPGAATSATSSHDSSPDTETVSTIHIDSATMINSIVESSILKETRDVKASSSGSDTKKEAVGSSLTLKEESKDDASTEVPSPPRPRAKTKRSKKVRNLRNPGHKSREVVTDSDSDSEDEKPKAKPVTPRRKTIETERVKTPKRSKEPESEEEEGQASKKLRRRKEEEEDSLVCQETLPGSPVQSCTTELPLPATTKATSGREERSSSRVELPFASVAAVTQAQAEANTKSGLAAGLASSLKAGGGSDSPPATPDSPGSVESPLTRSRKEDGRKSPADSSEVDLESLSGRGKAGSEDSRLDVECSSSSDTKTGRGRRRPTASKDVEKEEEKIYQSSKRKRKTRDSTGRGRGKGRGRNSSGVGRAVGRHNEDTEDDSGGDGRSQEEPRLDRLDNAALAALAAPKPNSTSKYNFYVLLNPEMDASERISKLQGTIEELRTTYLNIKGDLCAIERRRKKIRRKERERTHQTTEVAA